MNTEYYKRSLKTLAIFCLYIALVRFSQGAFLGVMAIMGMIWAFNSKIGKALSIYVMIMFMVSINPNILPKNGTLYTLGLRVGPLLIGIALAIRGISMQNRRRLPLGMMLAYLLIAVVSSIDGWAPQISYFKIVNFAVFFMGIWLGTQSLEYDGEGIMVLRSTFFALSAFLILGSIAVMPFPAISTLSGLQQAQQIGDIALLNQMLIEAAESGEMSLFCGVTMQSQALSPMLACSLGWLLCDLLFIEEKFRWPHVILILLALPLLYKTRSRVALFTLLSSLLLVYYYLPRHMRLRSIVRRWLGSMLVLFAIILTVVAAISEIHSDAMSRWLRKIDDVETDKRSLSEAVTASRQGLIEECMADFRRNPLFGSGFQVSWFTAEFARSQGGLVLSSPIEKGILPIMVLGETGIVGEIVFIAFLISFFSAGGRRHLYLSIAMMSLLLVTNLGEATFFSPGGVGGTLWIMCVVGGYALDVSFSSISFGRGYREYHAYMGPMVTYG